MSPLEWLHVEEPTLLALAVVVLHGVVALGTTGHILLTKESPRSAAGWAALVWLSPLLGALAYLLLGVNRVARKAVRLRGGRPKPRRGRAAEPGPDVLPAHLAPMSVALDAISGRSLAGGNRVQPLLNGEETFPAMLEAIGSAQHTVTLMTFIFDRDPWGLRFVDALAAARARGVEVRLLIDGVGVWFSFPHVLGALRRAGVPYARFLWSLNPMRMALLNLRNHRKILVVDGRVGFTGGMNLRGSFVQELTDGTRTADQDLHFRVEGPIVAELQDLFAADWAFETGETLEGPGWYPALDAMGEMWCRVVPDGPDGDMLKAEMTLFEAVCSASRSVSVVTPYFLPEEALTAALVAAARRGVAVDVVVPARSNQPLAAAAMRADLPALLEHGVRVWAQAAPFDHAKLVTIDGAWSCVGSANWDPRSLRLNFEMLLEVWSPDFAGQMLAIFEAKRARSTRVDGEALLARSVFARLVDGLARLFRPYL